jgi:hypothetical protein
MENNINERVGRMGVSRTGNPRDPNILLLMEDAMALLA